LRAVALAAIESPLPSIGSYAVKEADKEWKTYNAGQSWYVPAEGKNEAENTKTMNAFVELGVLVPAEADDAEREYIIHHPAEELEHKHDRSPKLICGTGENSSDESAAAKCTGLSSATPYPLGSLSN
jgi:hypothetical protein